MGEEKPMVGQIVKLTTGDWAGFEAEVSELNEDGTVKTYSVLMPSNPDDLRRYEEIGKRKHAEREREGKEG